MTEQNDSNHAVYSSVPWLSEELGLPSDPHSRDTAIASMCHFVWTESRSLPYKTLILWGRRITPGVYFSLQKHKPRGSESFSPFMLPPFDHKIHISWELASWSKWGVRKNVGGNFFLLPSWRRWGFLPRLFMFRYYYHAACFPLYACACPFGSLSAASCFQACYISLVSILWDFACGITRTHAHKHTHTPHNILSHK